MHQYHQLLSQIRKHGRQHTDRTGVGTRSIFGYTATYDLANGFPLLTTKRLPFKIIAEELFWFLSGSTRLQHLQNRGDTKGNPIRIWDEWGTAEACAKFKRPAGEFGPTYGHQWRNYGATPISQLAVLDSMSDGDEEAYYDTKTRRWINYGYMPNGFDQIAAICQDLATNPNSRRLIVDAWNAKDAREVTLPPCHPWWQLKYDETSNVLSLETHMRSADAFLGVPFNLASYALLLHLLAACFNMKPGTVVQSFGDVHIYNTHIEQVETVLGRLPRALPTISICETLTCRGFDGLMDATWDHIKLGGYDPHPAVKAEVAV